MAKLWCESVRERNGRREVLAISKWYVIQVETGREQKMCDFVTRLCAEYDAQSDVDDSLLQECFAPRFRTQRKRMGQWMDVEHQLLPGYVIAVTDNPGQLAQVLRKMPEFARLLAQGETYVPLSSEERSWLGEQTHKGDRVVPMSFGYKRGDTLVVTEGPLKGREAVITRVNRANSLAHLELHVGQMTIRTTVGLGLLGKDKESEKQRSRSRRTRRAD